ncbi:unnamed protein product [Ambrosiozyma monospora]|uniref:Unnamed protein product n=1 Tax=Ambrosiozyma monospora TaxID=43982 RepID=A0ACB5SXV1_AMBMO|nr:unnamed protein product [Ambrosiozyma monospora]
MKVLSLSSCFSSSSTLSPCLKFNVQELSKFDHNQSTPDLLTIARNWETYANSKQVIQLPLFELPNMLKDSMNRYFAESTSKSTIRGIADSFFKGQPAQLSFSINRGDSVKQEIIYNGGIKEKIDVISTDDDGLSSKSELLFRSLIQLDAETCEDVKVKRGVSKLDKLMF